MTDLLKHITSLLVNNKQVVYSNETLTQVFTLCADLENELPACKFQHVNKHLYQWYGEIKKYHDRNTFISYQKEPDVIRNMF